MSMQDITSDWSTSSMLLWCMGKRAGIRLPMTEEEFGRGLFKFFIGSYSLSTSAMTVLIW